MEICVLRVRGHKGSVIAVARVHAEHLLLRTAGSVAARLGAKRVPKVKIEGDDGSSHWVFRIDRPLIWELGPLFPDLERQLRECRPAWFDWIDAEIVRHRASRCARQRLTELAGATEISWADAGDSFDALAEDHPWHRLRPYQQAGVRWLWMAQGRTLLADDMGLGKTPQTLVYLDLAQCMRTLVVCPSVVVSNWAREASIWAPDLKFEALGSRAEVLELIASPPAGRLGVSVSWGLLRLVREELGSLQLDTIVADEIHYAANPDSQRTQSLLWLGTRTGAERRIGLTGTEIRNRPKELWPLLRFLDPLRFRAFTRFGERFCGPRYKRVPGPGGKTIKIREYNGASNLRELNKLVRGYAIRREKIDVLHEVPAKTRQILEIPYPAAKRSRTAASFERIKTRIGRDGTSEQLWAMGQLATLRQEAGLAKVEPAADWINEALSAGEPVVVFLHHSEVKTRLVAALIKRGVESVVIDGGVPTGRRAEIIDQFMDGEVDVIIGSTAMKEGVTLTRARFTLHVERFWVPADEEQAEDRVCRIGQRRAVLNTYLHLVGSLDDYVAKIIEAKRQTLTAIQDRSMERQLLELLRAT